MFSICFILLEATSKVVIFVWKQEEKEKNASQNSTCAQSPQSNQTKWSFQTGSYNHPNARSAAHIILKPLQNLDAIVT